jgi:hypothetical protein
VYDQRTAKYWGVIFCCMASRAIHLELAVNYSELAFTDALHKFVARRSKPIVIYCDLGTQLMGAKNQIDRDYELMKKQALEFCNDEKIEFKVQRLQAPWCGGTHERLIRSVKEFWHKIETKQRLTFSQLLYVMVRIEQCVNSRPLLI